MKHEKLCYLHANNFIICYLWESRTDERIYSTSKKTQMKYITLNVDGKNEKINGKLSCGYKQVNAYTNNKRNGSI